MNKEKIIPEIRFAGFTDDWEQRKVFSMSKETFGGGTPTTGIEEYWNGDFPWIQSSDVKFDDLNNITPSKFITQEALNNSATKAIPANSIAIVTRVGVGKLAFMPYPYSTSQDFISLSSLNVDSLFGLYSLYKLLKKEINNIQGTSIKGITKSDLLGKNINIPVDTNEQMKIGKLMKGLDNTITLHQQLLTDYKQFKKALLQQLFPQKGETVPRIRFDGFTTDWNKNKIGDLLLERNERSGDGELLSITINSGVVKLSDLNRTDNSSKDKSNYKKVEKNDIAYNSMRMWQGASGLSKYTGIVSPAYTVIVPTERVSPLFISYQFKLSSMIQIFQANSQGLTSDTWNLKYPLLKNIKIKIPIIEEQEKIGQFFKQLDETIAGHELKLATYQDLKKALLQRMFV